MATKAEERKPGVRQVERLQFLQANPNGIRPSGKVQSDHLAVLVDRGWARNTRGKIYLTAKGRKILASANGQAQS